MATKKYLILFFQIMCSTFLVSLGTAGFVYSQKNDFRTPEMVFVKGGAFNMGSPRFAPDAKPTHKVLLDSYYISKFEITNQDFVLFLNNGECTWFLDSLINIKHKYSSIKYSNKRFYVIKGAERYPVTRVSFDGAKAYCAWLSNTTKKKYRLPTEAEWEYAARGGVKSRGYLFAGSNNAEEVSWHDKTALYVGGDDDQQNEVGLKKGNELGIYDMSGNVGEWCEDWFDDDYYERSAKRNPVNKVIDKRFGALKVVRGGSWRDLPMVCSVFYRMQAFTYETKPILGIRVVREAD
ncbi:formylglycine-generating enzyme family protein [Microscilla marina]|nr:formylglycine-generating enzyme family protein [Microscilla marina]